MADAKSKAHIYKCVSTFINIPGKGVEDCVPGDVMEQFLSASVVDGKRVDKILWYAQDKGVICTTGDTEPLKGRCAYAIRLTGASPVANAENDVNIGTVGDGKGSGASTLQSLTKIMSEVYEPCLETNLFGYVKKMKPAEKEELEALNKRCITVIDKAIESLANGMELAKLEDGELVRAARSLRA